MKKMAQPYLIFLKAPGKYLVLLLLVVALLPVTSCKKEGKGGASSDPEILSLSFSQGGVSTLNKDKKLVQVFIADYIDRKNLVAIFQLSNGSTAKVNGAVQKSSDTPNDFTSPVTYEVTSNGRTVNWTVDVESNTYDIGLGSVVQADKRLSRDYEWYQSQDTTGVFSSINGGATCLAMTLLWASRLEFAGVSTFTVRSEIAVIPSPDFKPLVTNMLTSYNITRYLTYKGIDWRLVKLSGDYSEITEAIDKGYLVFMNADMTYIPFNGFPNQHVNRFYVQFPAFFGHYFLVKGYKKVDGFLYYEVYDPYNLGQKYSGTTEIKGRNRYYYSEAVRQGGYGADGWKYAIVIHDKGNPATFPVPPLKNEVSADETKLILNPLNGVGIFYSYGY